MKNDFRLRTDYSITVASRPEEKGDELRQTGTAYIFTKGGIGMEQLSREQGINILHRLYEQWVDQNNQEIEEISITEKKDIGELEEKQRVV